MTYQEIFEAIESLEEQQRNEFLRKLKKKYPEPLQDINFDPWFFFAKTTSEGCWTAKVESATSTSKGKADIRLTITRKYEEAALYLDKSTWNALTTYTLFTFLEGAYKEVAQIQYHASSGDDHWQEALVPEIKKFTNTQMN